MTSLQVIAFDCDGVMFDSTSANRAYYNHVLAHFGRPPMTPAQFQFVHMHTVQGSLAHLFQDPAELEAALAFQRQMDYTPFFDYMEMEPDLITVLQWLRPRFRTAVATNRTTTIERLLKAFHLSDYFDLVVSASDVNHPKPAPDMLVKVVNHFGIEPQQALFVGDSEVDATAAEAAGFHFAAYGNPTLTACWYLRRLGDLCNILNGIQPQRHE